MLLNSMKFQNKINKAINLMNKTHNSKKETIFYLMFKNLNKEEQTDFQPEKQNFMKLKL